MRAKGATIICYKIRAVLMGTEVAYSFKVVVLKVGTLHNSLINIRIRLVGSFMLFFRLLMKGCLAIMIILSSVVVCL